MMNFRHHAIAAICACAASASFAQTANPVTLYGRVYVMAESVKADEGATPVARRSRLSDRNSILGVRGSEDLGGGLKAFFQLETLFGADAPSAFATRNSGVGLQGSWGSVLFGRWDTPFKVAHAAAVDAFGDLALPDITAAGLNQANFQRRENNVVQYWSPNWSGLTFRGHYQANEGKTTTANPYSYGASAVYRRGNVYLSYAWEKHIDQDRTSVAAGIDEEGNAVSATWQLGPVKLSGQYGEYKKTNTKTQKSYYAGAVWTLGNHALLASYQNSRDGGATTAAQPSCDLVGVGYNYVFSRRTAFVSEYASVKNKVGSLCNFGTSPVAITAGQDPQGFAVGLRHVF